MRMVVLSFCIDVLKKYHMFIARTMVIKQNDLTTFSRFQKWTVQG